MRNQKQYILMRTAVVVYNSKCIKEHNCKTQLEERVKNIET